MYEKVTVIPEGKSPIQPHEALDKIQEILKRLENASGQAINKDRAEAEGEINKLYGILDPRDQKELEARVAKALKRE